MDLLANLNDYCDLRLIVAAVLGAFIGLERELSGKDPSLRTFALISVGSCLFTLLSSSSVQGDLQGAAWHGDPSRIAAQIVTGIGFLGAGAIFRSARGVSGLTTAALMWVTAAIGMAVGFGRTDLALSATLVALLIALSMRLLHKALRILGLGGTPPNGGGNESLSE